MYKCGQAHMCKGTHTYLYVNMHACTHVVALGTQTCVFHGHGEHMCMGMCTRVKTHICMANMVRESTERWHTHIHVCTLTRLCACIKRTNPVLQLTYTFMCMVWHLLKGGAEWQNMFPCVYAHTEVGDLMKVCNFKRHTGGTPLLFAKCQPMKHVYLCGHVVHTDVHDCMSRNNKRNKLTSEQGPYPPT